LRIATEILWHRFPTGESKTGTNWQSTIACDASVRAATVRERWVCETKGAYKKELNCSNRLRILYGTRLQLTTHDPCTNRLVK